MCEDCGWVKVREQIEEALDSGDFEWAEDTLDGIADWIDSNEHVTEKQIEAVRNILARGR